MASKLVERDAATSVETISPSQLKSEVRKVREIAVEVIRNRIDVLGTSEPEIPEGEARIVVRLPGVDTQTRAEAKAQISKDAVLSFKLIHPKSREWVRALSARGSIPTGFRLVGEDRTGPILVRDPQALADGLLDRDYFSRLKRFGNQAADFMLMEERLSDGSTVFRPEYVERRRQLGGDSIKDASVSYEPMTGLPSISLEFDKEGKKAFGRITEMYQPQEGYTADSPLF